MGFPPCPEVIRPVGHLLKLAEEHEDRNIVVAYWARIAAINLAMQILPDKRPPEVTGLISALLDWLEKTKKEHAQNDGIVNETAAQAIIEEYVLSIFNLADKQDRAEIFNKRTIKLFYISTLLFDVLEQFGPSEEMEQKRKYAKWKATYIHNCLKQGIQPVPGDPSRPDRDVSGISSLTDDERKMVENNFNLLDDKNGEDDVGGGSAAPDTPNPPNNNGNDFVHAPVSSPVTPVPSTPFLPPTVVAPQPTPSSGNIPTPDQIQQAQKHCKFATSALNYDDIKTAVDNLEKALKILKMQ